MFYFWVILSLFYIFLAIASYITGREHKKDIRRRDFLEIGSPDGKKDTLFGATERYLDRVTWISIGGFLLAAFAAVLSYFYK